MKNVNPADWQIVVMGVAGCGKSTIGQQIAERLGCRFIDGDSLHPLANVQKMAAGTPLTDEDRWPWLDLVGLALTGAPNTVDGFAIVRPTGTVVAASALKKVYRDRIRSHAKNTIFIHLAGERELLLQRISNREGHFMKAEMLDSQLAILESLAADEVGYTLDISSSPEVLVEAALGRVAQRAQSTNRG